MNARAPLNAADLLALARAAALEVAPVFALDRFVATNPFLGHAGQPFAEAARELALTRTAGIIPSRDAFRQALAAGDVTDADIAAALAAHGMADDAGAVAAVRLALSAPAPETRAALPTAATLFQRADGRNLSSLVIDHLSRFCARMAGDTLPLANEALLTAWREDVDLDWSVAAAGLGAIETQLRKLPRSVEDMLVTGQLATGLGSRPFALYLRRLLADVAGWAAFWRGKKWDEDQNAPGAVLDLLAMRLGWDIALMAHTPVLATQLHDTIIAAVSAEMSDPASTLDLILQDALENAWRRSLFDRLASAAPSAEAPASPLVHAVFCIDVRSEPLRRALEAQDKRISTGGFAGFFGLPLDVVSTGHEASAAHCPALISPALVAQSTSPASALQKGWNGLLDDAARHPLASLGFVETLGFGYGLKHVAAAISPAFGKSGPADLRKPSRYAISRANGTPLDVAGRADFAAAMLRGMGLSTVTAPVIVLVGHGASTRNNAHAASYNCGACGGHSGEANAVVAAELLNDPAVRQLLAARGLVVPDETVFVPALHDTTTHAVTLLLDPAGPISDTVRQTAAWFAAATQSIARPGHLSPLPGTAIGRSQDWSAVRPEWGLAGCAAFIAGPRAATRNVDLEGRAFLHSYDWRSDAGFAVLETILTAPLVVASWINLQYFGATRDNAAFGGGNKLLHNVVAGVGVIEGAGGDLRPGLPIQSLHDGVDFVHKPLRLTALIEAPADAILAIIARQQHLRQLLDNHWITLFRTENGIPVERYGAGAHWVVLDKAQGRATA